MIVHTAAQHLVVATIWLVFSLVWWFWFGVRDIVQSIRSGSGSPVRGRAMGAISAVPLAIGLFLLIYWNK